LYQGEKFSKGEYNFMHIEDILSVYGVHEEKLEKLKKV
jgi:hypothetical protein